MSKWLKDYLRKKKRERIANALSEMNEILGYCEREERRLRNAATEEDRNARRSRKDPIGKKLHEEQADLTQRYIQLLSDEINNVLKHNASRQVARAMKIGDNSKTSKKSLTRSGI